MKRCLAVLVLSALVMRPAEAGVFGKKSAAPRPEPGARVPELLYHVKMDSDERKRAAAAEELRGFDLKQFPEIVLILCDVLEHDKSTTVRLEAAQSLGKIRPVSAMAGQALEQASAKDPAFRVRMQAWTSLRLCHLAGYRSGAAKDKQEFSIQLVNPGDSKEKAIVIESPAQTPAREARTPQLFPLKATAKSSPPPPQVTESDNLARPLPSGPAAAPGFSTAIPNPPPRVTPPPERASPEGPGLEPPS